MYRFIIASLVLFLSLSNPLSALLKGYVVNTDSSDVSVIDLSTNTVITTIPVNPNPNYITANLDGTKVYVPDVNGVIVQVIDTTLDAIIATPTVGTGPVSMIISPDNLSGYIVNMISSDVSVMDIATNTIIATISVGTTPTSAAITPTGSKVYVTNSDDDSVSVIDTTTNTVIATIPVLSSPQYVTIMPDGSQAYVVDVSTASVSVIDTTFDIEINQIIVGTDPTGVVFTPDGTQAYLIEDTLDIGVINTATQLEATTLGAGLFLSSLAMMPDGSKLYLTNRNSDDVSVIETSIFPTLPTIIATIPMPSPAFGLISSNGSTLYVISVLGEVDVIDTASETITATIGVGLTPAYMVIADVNTIEPVSNPTNLSGQQDKNRLFTQTDLINVLTWDAPTIGTPPVSYKIYRNVVLTDLAGTVSATGPLEFQDHNRRKNTSYTYYVVSVDQDGNRSSASSIVVTP